MGCLCDTDSSSRNYHSAAVVPARKTTTFFDNVPSDPNQLFRNMQSRRGKIDVAALSMCEFISKVMSRNDRCSIVAFNENYRPIVHLGSESDCLAAMLILTSCCKGGTHLWDAIATSVLHFISVADRTRPWLLVILTDGADTGSEITLTKAAGALQLFNAPGSNFCFVVGIGSDVKTSEMKTLCNSSGSLYVPASSAEVLKVLFAAIALQVREGIRVDIARIMTEDASAIYARVQQQTQLARQPVDMLFLIDVSGSMETR